MWTIPPNQGSRKYCFTSLCLLLCLLVFASALPLPGADMPLAELSEEQLLGILADNLTTLGDLQDQQRIELETAQTALLTAQERSSKALMLSTEAQRLSTEAMALASQSKDSVMTASVSFASYKDAMQAELDRVNRQATWLKVGLGACLVIAAGALVWTAVATTGGM